MYTVEGRDISLELCARRAVRVTQHTARGPCHPTHGENTIHDDVESGRVAVRSLRVLAHARHGNQLLQVEHLVSTRRTACKGEATR